MIAKRNLAFIGLAFLTVGTLGSCQSAGTPTLAELSQPGIGVGISDDVCPSVQGKVGQQISWTNQGKQEHIVRTKPVDGQSGFDSGILKPGDHFVVTIAQAQIYQYECSADGSLTGTITIEP
jgi:hypothetical protein